jgi:hypothetical protein
MVVEIWRVTSGQFCGGFVVHDGIVVQAAPFLFRRVIGKSVKEALKAVLSYKGTKVERVSCEPT